MITDIRAKVMEKHIKQCLECKHCGCVCKTVNDNSDDVDAIVYYYTGLTAEQIWCLSRLTACLEEMSMIDNMVGMTSIKTTFVRLMKFVANLKADEMERDSFLMHMVISGPPGHGKTEIAKLLGRAFLKSGLLKSDKFLLADRSRLIGKYCGWTAKATKEAFEEARGGVIFIDEVYSLGNKEGRDAFTKECIDTINQCLTEMTDTLCIIAGYEEEIETCFFSYNPGLKRRFPWRFNITQYKAEDLIAIFYKKVRDSGRIIENDALVSSDIDTSKFKNAGGDIANLVTQCVLAHYEHAFMNKDKEILTRADVIAGLKRYLEHNRTSTTTSTPPPPFGMYS